jgi:hypothetical protein
MTQFEEQVLRDLAELKAHMRWIVGNGIEGKIQEMERRITRQEAFLQKAMGLAVAIGGLITLAHLAVEYLKVGPR